jgi:hypothetical protein
MYGITEIHRGIHHIERESGFNGMSPVVASRLFLGMPSASTLTRGPAPGLLRLGFRAWRIASDKNKPGAPVAHAIRIGPEDLQAKIALPTTAPGSRNRAGNEASLIEA